MTTTFDFKDGNGPVPAHQHENGLGWVADTAPVESRAGIPEDAWVYETPIYGKAWVYGEAMIFEGAEATCAPIVILGLRWAVTITDDHIQIGYENHKTDEWEKFNDRRIKLISDDALEFWVKHRASILGLARVHQSE